MKYIRICDEYENEYITTYQQHCEDVANMQDSGFDFEGCIIKQADTIEELCDGFIFKDTHANELHFLDKNSGISLLGASLFEETLRGFIETDKGLIYVAKMNDKGELELL